jgi:hypothetical protein
MKRAEERRRARTYVDDRDKGLGSENGDRHDVESNEDDEGNGSSRFLVIEWAKGCRQLGV